MEFSEVLNLILESCPFLKNNDYDGIIVKKLAATNTISDTGASHQSHMAFTGKQKDFFPYLNADGYFNVGYESKDDDLKKYFTLQIPVTIYKENTDELTKGLFNSINYSSDKKTVRASVLRSRRNNGDDQIELSIKSLDDEDFIEFRKLLRVNDFFVLLKQKNHLKYDLVGIRSSDKNAEAFSRCTDFYKIGTQTPVEIGKFDIKGEKKGAKLPFSRNRIIFGAPGTGKSHSLEQERENNFADDCYERVTFHPNSSYAQFVGTYKPTMTVKETDSSLTDEQKQILSILKDKNRSGQEKYDLLYDKFRDDSDLTRLPLLIGIYSDDEFRTKKADGSYTANDNGVERNHGRAVRPYINLNLDCVKEEITYEYTPGPFMRIYTAAKQNPSQNFLLLIEEINRANVAAVFGDVFQLLDRDENGNSEYPVAVSEDIKKYLAKNGIHEDELKIPSNMYIWATMNSADQGVFPMDTAFKRRWEFEYIGIDENEDKVKGYEIPISATKKVNWNDLRKAINNKLITLGINEDKLLGPFFLSKMILDSALDRRMDFVRLFESKVLVYLFEDAAKMKAKQLFNVDEKKFIYSEVCKKFELEGLKVFKFNEEDVVEEHDIAIKKDDASYDGKLF